MHPVLDSARHALIVERRALGRDELTTLATLPDAEIEALLSLASEVRDQYCGQRAYVEVIYNAKKGGCSEDCHFCSQSARFASDVDPEPLKTVDDFIVAAGEALARGAGEFCIVVAVRGPSNALLARVAEAVRAIKATMPLEIAVSLGILTDRHLEILAAAGVDKVNHNLESSERFFPSVCTTHTYAERYDTCRRVRAAGLELCCGGIIGMGETMADRVDFLCALQELGPTEVPINFLDPRPGTPFADRSVMEPMEALRYVAMARLALPSALIRFAGGREITLRGLQDLGMQGGASGLILGNYLTTKGRSDADDFAMLDRLGFEVMR
ncbi:MAG: biotin synthase BioB [Vulcanimicrobiaceae bacterium]